MSLSPERQLELLLKQIPHHYQVAYALYCAKSVQHLLAKNEIYLADKAISLVELWLKDKSLVSDQELWTAALAAPQDGGTRCYFAATYAAYAACSPQHASAYVMATTTNVLASVAINYTPKERTFETYFNKLKELLADMSPLEKAVYGL